MPSDKVKLTLEFYHATVRRMNRKLYAAVCAASLSVAALAGCSANSSSDSVTPSKDVTVSAKPKAKAKPTSPDTKCGKQVDDPNAVITVPLNGTAVWSNCITARLSGFERGVTSDTAAPSNTPYLRFKVTMKNGWNQPMDLSATMLECVQGDEVFDGDRGLNGAPGSHLLPGQKRTWDEGCVFKTSENKLQVEITPSSLGADWYRTAIFTGTIG